MTACQEVKRWMTEEVQVPVESAIYQFRQACEEARRAIEEAVERPATDWVRREERRCREQDCNWWCLCCNKWFCWIAVVLVKVITWVVVMVIKWVVTIVCQVVAFVVDIVVKLVLRIIKFLVSFFVCLFTDPEGLGLSFGDLWSDLTGIVDDVIDFVGLLLDDVVGILGDVRDFLLDLGESFGPLGTLIFGLIAGALDVVAKFVDIVGGLLDAVGDIVIGLITGNLCRVSAGITNLGVGIGRVILTAVGGLFGILSGGRRGFEWGETRMIVERALEQTFPRDEARLRRNLERVRISAYPMGLPMTIDARRMVIRSSEFLRALHNDDDIIFDLYAIAGHGSDCGAGWATSTRRIGGEVVYRGTGTRVSYSDLNAFLRDGPDAAPPFDVYPITLAAYRRYLAFARDRGHRLGVDLRYELINDYEVTDRSQIPLPTGAGFDAATFTPFGRTGTAADPLVTIPALAIFFYDDETSNGLASWWRPPPYVTPCSSGGDPDGYRSFSGVTFLERTPDWVFKSVLIHEIGHYLGLCHDNHDGLEHIMFSPRENEFVTFGTVWAYLGLAAEPEFVRADVEETWRWITQVGRDSLLP